MRALCLYGGHNAFVAVVVVSSHFHLAIWQICRVSTLFTAHKKVESWIFVYFSLIFRKSSEYFHFGKHFRNFMDFFTFRRFFVDISQLLYFCCKFTDGVRGGNCSDFTWKSAKFDSRPAAHFSSFFLLENGIFVRLYYFCLQYKYV